MPFPPDTTYATVAEWQARTSAASASYGQQLLNDAAYMVDQLTRGALLGYEAFSQSTGEVRVFDDDMTDSIDIDDLVGAPTLVQRGLVTLAALYYKTWPYNTGKGPTTKLIFRADAMINATSVATSLWYGHPYRKVGAGQIAVTGAWGYCAQGDRPAIVKEATLAIARLMYQQNGLSMSEVMQMLMHNPTQFLTQPVWDRLSILRRERLALIV